MEWRWLACFVFSVLVNPRCHHLACTTADIRCICSLFHTALNHTIKHITLSKVYKKRPHPHASSHLLCAWTPTVGGAKVNSCCWLVGITTTREFLCSRGVQCTWYDDMIMMKAYATRTVDTGRSTPTAKSQLIRNYIWMNILISFCWHHPAQYKVYATQELANTTPMVRRTKYFCSLLYASLKWYLDNKFLEETISGIYST